MTGGKVKVSNLDKEELYALKSGVFNLHEYLKENAGKDVNVLLSFEWDVMKNALIPYGHRYTYTIDGDENEVVDYLVVNRLKVFNNGNHATFDVYDSTIESRWDNYNDCMVDGEIYSEFWDDESDFEDELMRGSITLGAEGVSDVFKRLTYLGLPVGCQIYVGIDKKGITVELSNAEDVLDNKNPYLSIKEAEELLKELLSWDASKKELVENLKYMKAGENESIEEVLDEFKTNVNLMLTHDNFSSLIRDYTVVEADECCLYVDTYNRKATLLRYFKGSHLNVNTVGNIPLTMTAEYDTEDTDWVSSTAHKSWARGELNGRIQRVLLDGDDYFKFTRVIEHFFPSLKDENGVLSSFGVNLVLGDVKPFRLAHSPEFSSYMVVGEKPNDKKGLEKVLASVHFESGLSSSGRNKGGLSKFYYEYDEFLKWLNAN